MNPTYCANPTRSNDAKKAILSEEHAQPNRSPNFSRHLNSCHYGLLLLCKKDVVFEFIITWIAKIRQVEAQTLNPRQ